jgi:hypothetical protein
MTLITALWGSAPAIACVYVAPADFVVDTTVEDDLPPATPVVVGVAIGRGRGPEHLPNGGMSSSSCDSGGWIVLTVDRPSGFDPVDGVGYRFEWVDGTLPDDFVLRDPAAPPIQGPELAFHWEDGATEQQEAFAFTLAIVPVDLAGNEGIPLEVLVADEGRAASASDVTGCSTVAGTTTLGCAAMAIGASFRRRRPFRASS